MLNLRYIKTLLLVPFLLSALSSLAHSQEIATENGIANLYSTQNPDGGWGLTAGDRSEIYYTAKVLQALLEILPTSDIFQAITSGAQFLSAHRNPGAGYGEGGSTVWESALAFLVLSRTSGDVEAQLATLDYLLNSQLPNGSWDNDPYSTALVLQALVVQWGVVGKGVPILKQISVDQARMARGGILQEKKFPG